MKILLEKTIDTILYYIYIELYMLLIVLVEINGFQVKTDASYIKKRSSNLVTYFVYDLDNSIYAF